MVAFLWRLGLRKGVLGGSRAFLGVFAVASLLRLAKKAQSPEVVLREQLRPGQTLVIAHEAPSGGRRGRRGRRRAAAAEDRT